MIRRLITGVLVIAVVSGATAVVLPQTAHAASVGSTTPKATTTKVTPDPYAYTAKAGDSYTVLARKSVQTYGIREKVNLSLAQIVAAETFMSSDAGFPELNLGQAVTFKVDDVKAVVKKVQTLTTEQKAAWQVYVPSIDFDTRDNG